MRCEIPKYARLGDVITYMINNEFNLRFIRDRDLEPTVTSLRPQAEIILVCDDEEFPVQ